ncbi:MAG: MFS transporter [Ignavibacteriales bacterium]|nr:MFS transporter [Ignavibacteriales bacterium]
MSNKPHDPYAALRYPDFRNLVTASFLLTIALQMQETVIGYELYRLTHDPMSLGLIGLVEAVPFISFSLFGGHIADKYSKRKILLWSVACIALSSMALHFFFRNPGTEVQYMLLATIYAALFVIGLCRAFQSPTATSLRGFLVPFELYENASMWSSSAWQVGAIAGPVCAGFIYSWIGFSDTLLFVVALVIMTFLLYWNIGEQPVVVPEEVKDLFGSIKEGIRFVFRKQIILYSISLDLFSVLFGGVVALLPIYAQDILHVGPQGLGILRAAPSLGSVLMLVLMARFSPMEHAWRNLLIAVTGFGISILVFAVSPWMALSVAALFLSGVFDSISVVIRATILQIMTPDEMRGRVMAVNGMFLAASNELGAFESGFAAKLMGTIPSAIFGGVLTLLIVTWVRARTSGLLGLAIHKDLD